MSSKFLFLLCLASLILLTASRDCLTSCSQIQITADLDICMQNCYQAYIVAGTVSGVVVIILIACLVYCCYGKKFQCIPLEMRRLKKLYNVIDPDKMTPEAFEHDKEIFYKTMLKSQKVNNLWFVKEDKYYAMVINSIQFTKKEDFLYKIEIQGKDDFQEWHGNGYFLCGQSGSCVWFLKEYQNSQNAIQAGLLKYVVFEAIKERSRSYEGRWYCKNEQRNDKLSGGWTMLMQIVNSNNKLEEIKTQSLMI